MPKEFPATEEALRDAIDDAINLFREDLGKYEGRVRRATEGVELTQKQFDALVSWDFNTGGALWRNSNTRKPAQLIQQIHRGDFSGDGFMGWLRPPEIRGRREREQALFQGGDYQATTVPVYRTDGNYRLRGIHSRISGEDLMAKLGLSNDDGVKTQGDPEELSWLARILVRLFGG